MRSSLVRWQRLGRTATASGRRLGLRTIGDAVLDSQGARPALSSPRGESDDRPRSTRAHCTVRVWLWCGPTRDALLPRSLAEAQPHGHRIGSAAAASHRWHCRVRSPRHAPRALIVPWGTGRPPTEHTSALRSADLVVVRAISRRAPPKFVGRGSAARPPHQIGGCGIKPSELQIDSRGPRAHCAVEYRTTAHGAHVRTVRCGLGCGAGQLATLSSPDRWPRLSRTTTATGQQLRLRTVGVIALDSRGTRPACSSPRAESDDS